MEDHRSMTILDSWSVLSEKTVFILDRSPYFSLVSSGHKVDGDFIRDPKKVSHSYENEPIIEPFDRSLWTCTVEAVVGYSRLVWDLFTPDQKSISILAIGPKDELLDQNVIEPFIVEKICTWNNDDQNLDQLLKSLAKRSHCHQIRPPNKLLQTNNIAKFPNCRSDSESILSSLDQALTALSQLTSSQAEKKARSNLSCQIEGNNGRVVLISSFQNDQVVNAIVEEFEQLLKSKNELLRSSASTSALLYNSINYCDLVIVNTFPITDIGSCSKIANSSAFKPNLHVKTYSVKSGRIIAGLLNNLCLQHYNLKSTTITGIPMKEEQNASSSSQYDVEIVHCSSIHEDIMNSGSPLLDGVIEVIDRNGFPCDTFKLGWCTPRSTTIELSHCVATSRITAVDVNSRPSTCLTNFLLNGRQVMLEISKSKSHRMTTHILASHGGELYIHSLATGQHKLNLNDPPSINDSIGGKVADYRSSDFISFMEQHTLTRTPLYDSLHRTCNLLKRQTLYWPITSNHTILMNVPNLLGDIIEKIPKETLSQSDIDECKRAIDSLCKHEKDAQALPLVSIVDMIKPTKSNVTKLEHHYKLLWNELEYFLRVHSTTQEHGIILDYMHLKHSSQERGTKRAASKMPIAASPMKRQRASCQLIPELTEISPTVISPQTAMLYKTGVSLYQTWSQLYYEHHRSRSKLTIVGRTQPAMAPLQPEQATRSDV